MFTKTIITFVLLGAVFADQPGYGYEPPRSPYKAEEKHEKGMPFDFGYAVQDEYTGNDFAHRSNSDGDTVTGEYRVLLPDGRTQIVTYTADHYNGYQAEVAYEGEAKLYNPPKKAYKQVASYSAPAPSYSAPAPTYKESAPAPAPAPIEYSPPAYEPSSFSAPEKPSGLYGAPSY